MRTLLAFLLIASSGHAAIANVQKKLATQNNGTPATTNAFTFTSSVTSGNLIVIGMVFCLTSCNAITYTDTIVVTDTLGTSYQRDICKLNGSFGGTSYKVCIFSGKAAGTGSDTVTVTFGTATIFACMSGSEWSGAASSSWFDQSGSNNNAASANPTIATVGATAVTGELVYSFMNDFVSVAAGSGFTPLNNNSAGLADEYLIGSAPQVETALWTAVSAKWQGIIGTYKPPGVAAAPKHQAISQ